MFEDLHYITLDNQKTDKKVIVYAYG